MIGLLLMPTLLMRSSEMIRVIKLGHGSDFQCGVQVATSLAQMSYPAAGTAGRLRNMHSHLCRPGWSDQNCWQQRLHVQEKPPERPGFPTGPCAHLRAAQHDQQQSTAPAVKAVASATTLSTLVSIVRPAVAAEELPAADGAQASIAARSAFLPRMFRIRVLREASADGGGADAHGNDRNGMFVTAAYPVQ